MNREKALAKNTLILSVGTFLPKLTTLIALPILTEYLSKSEYGVYDLINTLVSLLIPLITLKLEMATFRFLIDCKGNKNESSKIISSSLSAILPISLVVVLIIFTVLRINSYDLWLCIFIALYFFLDNVYVLLQQMARGLGRNNLYSISAVTNSVVNMILIVVLVWKVQIGLLGVMIALDVALIISLAFLTVSLNIFSYFSPRNTSRQTLKEMLGYSWPLVPNSLSSWVINLSDRLIVVAVLGIEVNAIYAAANKIPSLFNTLQGTFISAWHENASISVNDSDTDDYYSHMFNLVFTMMIGIMAALIAITPLLFKLLISSKYADAYYQMPFLFGGMICFSLSSFLGGVYAAHKRTKSVGLTTTAAAVCNLLINLLFVRLIGLYAASISTFVSFLFLLVFRMIDVKKFQPMKYNMKKIILFASVITVMCCVSFINNMILNIANCIFGIIFAIAINLDFLKKITKSVMNKFKRR